MNRSSFRKWLITAAIILLLTVLQTGVGVFFSVKTIAPDLLFAFVLVYACKEREWIPIFCTALICGLFSDFVCHTKFIGYTAIYSYSALATYFLKNLLLKPNVFFVNTLALVIFILGKLMLFPVFYFTKEISFAEYFLNNTLQVAVYNTICFYIMYLVWDVLVRKGEKHDRAV